MKEKRSAKPLIAVVQSWSVERPFEYAGAETFSVSDMTDARAALKWCDGIVLTGGGDVNPKYYSDIRHPEVYGVDVNRDTLEFFIARKAREKNIPIMGICRGHQLINVAYGGSLVQHIKDSFTEKSHWGGMHCVRIRLKSAVGRAIGYATLYGTSIHHQAIDRVGEGLIATGWTDDGHIEIIESVPGAAQYVLGTQFHPEMDYQNYPSNPAMKIFKHFTRMAAKKSSRRRLDHASRRVRAMEMAGRYIMTKQDNRYAHMTKDLSDEERARYQGWWETEMDHGGTRSRYGWHHDAWSLDLDEDVASEEEAARRYRARKYDNEVVADSIYDPIRKIWIPIDEFEVDELEALSWQRDREVNREEALNAMCSFPPCVHPHSCNPYEGECWAKTVAEDRANDRIGPVHDMEGVGGTTALAVTEGKRGNGRDHADE